MKKFKISDKCVSCGLCFSKTDLIIEDEKGFAKPDERKIIPDDFMEEADNIVKQCPVGAISVQEDSTTKLTGENEKTKLAAVLKKKLTEIPKIKFDSSSVRFEASKYKINRISIPRSLDDDIDYRYSTKSAAKDDAVRKFRQYYSQLDAFILNVLGIYKTDVLSKYYSFDKACIYIQNNRKYERVLQEIYEEAQYAGIQLPEDFIEFHVIPYENDEYVYDKLKAFEMNEVAFESVKDEFNHRESEYLDMIYIDYESRFVSSGFFGDKYKDVYGYSDEDLEDAINEFVSDLNFSISMARDNISNAAYREIKSFVDKYNILTEAEIKRKIQQLTEANIISISMTEDNISNTDYSETKSFADKDNVFTEEKIEYKTEQLTATEING